MKGMRLVGNEILEVISHVVDSVWDDEKRGYLECEEKDGHVFEALKQTREWLDSSDKEVVAFQVIESSGEKELVLNAELRQTQVSSIRDGDGKIIGEEVLRLYEGENGKPIVIDASVIWETEQ